MVCQQDGLSPRRSLIRVVRNPGSVSSGWSVTKVVSHQGVSSGWSFTKVVYHQNGFSSGWPFIMVAFFLIRAVSDNGRLSSGWPFIRVAFFYQGSLIMAAFHHAGQSFITAVSRQGGFPSGINRGSHWTRIQIL